MTGAAARHGGLLLAVALLVLYCLYATRAMLYPAIGSDLVFNSDLLYVPQMVADVLAGGSFSQWYGQPAPAWFPDLALHFIAAAVGGGLLSALAIHACVVLALACLCVAMLARRLAPPGRPMALLAVATTIVALLLLDAGAVFYSGSITSEVLIANGAFAGAAGVLSLVPASHFTPLLLGLASLALVVDLHAGLAYPARRWRLAALAVLGLVCGASDALFIPQVAVPLALASAVAGWRVGRIRSAGLAGTAVLLFASLTGIAINSLFSPFDIKVHDVWRFGAISEFDFLEDMGFKGASHLAKAKQIVTHIPMVLQQIYASRMLMLLVYLGCLALVARRAVVLCRAPAAAARQTPALLVSVFVVASALCILVAVVLLTYEPYYFKNIWFYPVVILSLLWMGSDGRRRLEPLLGAAAAVAIVVLLAFTRAEVSRPIKSACADSVLSPTGLQRGLATHWIARSASLLGATGLEVSPVSDGIRGQFRIVEAYVDFYEHLANVKQRAGRFDFLAAAGSTQTFAMKSYPPRYGLPRRLAACDADLYMIYRPGLIELPPGGRQMG